MCSVAGNLPHRHIVRGKTKSSRTNADLLPTGMIPEQYEQDVVTV